MNYTIYNITPNIKNIIQYLCYHKYSSLFPTFINSTQHPKCPIITTKNKVYIGENACIKFYTNESLIIHLKDKSNDFINQMIL
jgi:hypothetical protein